MIKKALILIDGNNLYHCLKQLGIFPTDLDFLNFLIIINYDLEIPQNITLETRVGSGI